ncbi:tRNA (adenine(22)-N(1))-methyltransferase [Vibrio genomosp. F10]|nr:tRNA (adenine(22)-N(1))-methyltransferase TrmK [Vibrio genomosp. F10]
MKISNRLKQIDEMVGQEYDHIWDCCCDHGLLGATLLSRQAGGHIHFVDIVPELMTQLDTKLTQFYGSSLTPWFTHCIDVANLPIEQHEGRHLVIIAGVGGDLMIDLFEAIHRNNPSVSIDYLLCPVHHLYSLRKRLIELDFRLKEETLVEDNKRYYEILLVSSEKNSPSSHPMVSPVGKDIWNAESIQQVTTAKAYLTKTLSHYQRLAHHKNIGGDLADSPQRILNAYRGIKITAT